MKPGLKRDFGAAMPAGAGAVRGVVSRRGDYPRAGRTDAGARRLEPEADDEQMYGHVGIG